MHDISLCLLLLSVSRPKARCRRSSYLLVCYRDRLVWDMAATVHAMHVDGEQSSPVSFYLHVPKKRNREKQCRQ